VRSLELVADDGTWERHDGRDGVGRPVLVKAPTRAGDAAIGALRAEATVLATLSHPGLPHLEGWCSVEGRPGLVTSPGDVTTLDRCLADAPPDARQAVGIALDLADVLSALWDAGWVVGRLELAEVHVAPDGTIRLGDLGGVRRRGSAADAVEPEADAGMAVGTLLLDVLEQVASSHDDRQREILAAVAHRLADPNPTRRAELRTAMGLLLRLGAERAPLARPSPVVPDPEAATELAAPPSRTPTPEVAQPSIVAEPVVGSARPRRARRPVVLALAATALCALGANTLLGGPAPSAVGSPAHAAATPCPIAGDLEVDGGATSLAADVDGSGCTVSIHWNPGAGELVVVHPDGLRRYGLGRPGDAVAVADWDCDGIATPALSRPGVGAWRFDAWPTTADPGQPSPISVAELVTPPACDAG